MFFKQEDKIDGHPPNLKINMEPENTPLEQENHLPNHRFQVLCSSSRVYAKQPEFDVTKLCSELPKLHHARWIGSNDASKTEKKRIDPPLHELGQLSINSADNRQPNFLLSVEWDIPM